MSPFAFPHRESGNRRLSEGFPVLPITYYLLPEIETPQSLRDSSPTSGAIWLILGYLYIRTSNVRPLYRKLSKNSQPKPNKNIEWNNSTLYYK